MLEAEPDVVQVAIDYGDAATLTGASAPEDVVRRTPEAGRHMPDRRGGQRPAMIDTARLARANAESRSASLDEVLCIAGATTL